jgi:predicted TIM-barrel fold metal-dependent hydrolase
MLIDVHGHVTQHTEIGAYKAGLLASRGAHGRGGIRLSDEQVERATATHRKRIAAAQIDLQLLSPRPYTVMQWAEPERIVRWYIEECNNVIARHCQMYPDTFKGVCSLPQQPGVSPKNCIEELERCVNDLGFVGCMINPDPGEVGGDETPAMGDEYWYPLYEKMVELDVPGLIHSAACQSTRLTYSLHFINEENIAICSMLNSRVFEDFPNLKIVVSHGGGAIPYQMGRFMAGRYNSGGERWEDAVRKLYYDTCVYTKDGLDLLFKTMGPDRCLFGTENPGTGTATNPDTGQEMDDLKPVIESIEWLSEADRQKIFEGNAKALYKL